MIKLNLYEPRELSLTNEDVSSIVLPKEEKPLEVILGRYNTVAFNLFTVAFDYPDIALEDIKILDANGNCDEM